MRAFVGRRPSVVVQRGPIGCEAICRLREALRTTSSAINKILQRFKAREASERTNQAHIVEDDGGRKDGCGVIALSSLPPRPNCATRHSATTTTTTMNSRCSRPRQCRAAFLRPGRVRLTFSSERCAAHRYMTMYCSGYLRSGCRRSTADAT